MSLKSFEPWIRIRYRILKEELGNKEFTSKEVEEILKKHNKQLENINELLNILVKENLLEVKKINKQNIYQIKDKSLESNTLTKDHLIRVLKMGADIIRSRVDYKTLLILLFYKALSDN